MHEAADACVRRGYKKVFVVGEMGLVTELKAQGIDVVWEEEATGITRDEFDAVQTDPEVQAVVAGWYVPVISNI